MRANINLLPLTISPQLKFGDTKGNEK